MSLKKTLAETCLAFSHFFLKKSCGRKKLRANLTYKLRKYVLCLTFFLCRRQKIKIPEMKNID